MNNIKLSLNENWFYHIPRKSYILDIKENSLDGIISAVSTVLGIDKYEEVALSESYYESIYIIRNTGALEIIDRGYVIIINGGFPDMVTLPGNKAPDIAEIKNIWAFLV